MLFYVSYYVITEFSIKKLPRDCKRTEAPVGPVKSAVLGRNGPR